MIQKPCHRVDPLFAGWTARHDNTFAALRNRWRLVHKIGKIVTLDFLLDCSKQNGFLHNGSGFEVQRKRGSDSLAFPLRGGNFVSDTLAVQALPYCIRREISGN
jgi:hypothetical protein